MTTDAFEKRATLEVELPGGTVRLSAQAKGAGMIQPAFATMLCFVQTDAVAAGRDRRPAARRLRQALVRPHHRRRPAVDQRHRRSCSAAAPRASSVEPESEDELVFGQALDALLRQLALDIVPRRRGRAARRPRRRPRRPRPERRARRARDRQLAAGQDRAVRRRPELGPHRPGRRDGAARHRAAALRHHDRGHARSASRATPCATTRRTLAAARRRRRGRVRHRPARRRLRDRGLLLRPRPRVRHRSTPSTRPRGMPSRMRDVSTLLEALPVHPGVPRPHGRHQVRRRGDGATRRCARSSRATSCCSSTSA